MRGSVYRRCGKEHSLIAVDPTTDVDEPYVVLPANLLICLVEGDQNGPTSDQRKFFLAQNVLQLLGFFLLRRLVGRSHRPTQVRECGAF